MERPKFFTLESQSRETVLGMIQESDRPVDLDEIFVFVKEKRGSFFTSDVVHHSVMSLLCDNKLTLTPDLKIKASK